MVVAVEPDAAQLDLLEASGAAIGLLLLDVLFDEPPDELQPVVSDWRAAAGRLLAAA